MAKPLRVGIVSANWSLKVHGGAWRRRPDVEVVAICTAHEETACAAAQAHGIAKAYWDHRELCADPDIDIVDVGTRPSIRVPIVRDALAAGKHVYSALPFACSTEQADELNALRQEKGVVGVVDAQFRWVPAAQQMKAMIDDGFIGKPLGFNVQLFLPLVSQEGKTYAFSAFSPSVDPYYWLADAGTGAGGWRNFATHSLLYLTHLLGPIDTVSGMVAKGVDVWDLPNGKTLNPQNEDLGSATIRLANGAIGSVQAGWCVPDTEGMRIEIWGDKGRLLLTDPSFGNGIGQTLYAGDSRLMPYGQRICAPVPLDTHYQAVPDSQAGADQPYVAMDWMFYHMLQAVKGAEQASPSFAEAAAVHRAVEALFVSAREGRHVRLSE
ncbi:MULTISPECIES: Gfo/Idh/MocA family protein [unclassified Sphingobium]|uniref:Gfo/Idh/MocA family protein n=1 Tax=unclassified Sphingobium TaxID=2611147 RepID=UPI000D160730|nr:MULTISPECIES: Gfo/Idh/MocA family oxidoreductase [unclassified Sphingobium]MBG6120006.1 putative dehydrogenase [Sphingobium sp. JAI105]PSO12933.1 gfo/Idh/MocA family oxidoreductase [Sphingobium sp. AEW4]TWD05793.1 putative dehydrogenase [Sphingobium sp. AEW010]TWD23346.1 putative dehydrogenase [Sphingobium sp. AEW013]TWD25206.1 putative dehydrogenase [Sphingobium sp. AEW001]